MYDNCFGDNWYFQLEIKPHAELINLKLKRIDTVQFYNLAIYTIDSLLNINKVD